MELLEIDFFSLPIPIWGVDKQQVWGRKYRELLEMP